MQQVIDYIKNNLNEEQSYAALHINTSSLILAGAGSWKTRTLTFKIAYLLFGHAVPVQNILAVTFTNKAAHEMKERLVDLSEKMGWLSGTQTTNNTPSNTANNDESIDDFIAHITSTNTQQKHQTYGLHDFKWIGTFHSIFLKILKDDIEHGGWKYTKNFSIFDTSESKTVIKDILKKLNLQEIIKDNEVKNMISKLKNEWMSPQEFTKRVQSNYDNTIGKVYVEYQKALEEANVLDFDDLLLLPYMLFAKNPHILQKRQDQFHYIMVDEAQDTNRIQFELMKMLSAKHSNITLIGDDFQSIYGWRGAVMENFLQVKKYWPDIQMFKLQINYRSRPHIVHAGSHIIKNNVNQYQKDIKAHRTGDDKITVFSHRDEMDEAVNLVDLIKKMKDNNKIPSWSDVAILYRTNAQSSPFEQILIQEWIPYKVYGAFKFFERKEIKDVLGYVKCLLNPRDNVSLKRIINIPGRKIGKASLDMVEQYAIMQGLSLYDALLDIDTIAVPSAARNGIKQFLEVMQAVRTEWPKSTPADTIEQIIKGIKYRDYLVKEEWSDAAADEKYDNIGQLINMAEKYTETGEDTLRQFMDEVTLLTDAADNSWENAESIKLMTTHASKWLEFPLVFIVWLEDGIFPLANATLETKLLEEERRLMYVAITRAEDHVFLSYANSRMQWWQTKMNPPSRFIEELPAELLKKYDLGGWTQTTSNRGPSVDEWDTVKHKLFGQWYVLEVWNNLAIVKFHNPKFGVRKIEMRFLEVL